MKVVVYWENPRERGLAEHILGPIRGVLRHISPRPTVEARSMVEGLTEESKRLVGQMESAFGDPNERSPWADVASAWSIEALNSVRNNDIQRMAAQSAVATMDRLAERALNLHDRTDAQCKKRTRKDMLKDGAVCAICRPRGAPGPPAGDLVYLGSMSDNVKVYSIEGTSQPPGSPAPKLYLCAKCNETYGEQSHHCQLG